MDSASAKDLTCPVCQEIFKAPVVMTCEHNVDDQCLQERWKAKKNQDCPVCSRRSSKEYPPPNLELKARCEAFLKERKERCSSETEEICHLHNLKCTLFCEEDKQPVCVSCVNSETHTNHTFKPISEAISTHKEHLNTAVKSLEEDRKRKENIKEEVEKTAQHIKVQVEHTEHQIKNQFEILRQKLKEEEEATIAALKEEEEQKKQMMKTTLEEVNSQISTLTNTIKDTEEMLKASDDCFLKEVVGLMERVQISQPDPELPSGIFINVSSYIGKLLFSVLEKMKETVKGIIQNTPVFLDPKTAHPHLIVSDDLTSVKRRGNLPDITEKPYHPYVLGSEGYNSGKHSWDVEVKDSNIWNVGVTTASEQMKGADFIKSDIWSVHYEKYGMSEWPGFPVRENLECVRVELDYDSGTVSFYDSVKNTPLHTFTTKFTDTVFPFFHTLDSLKILPSTS